jgi:hypothetical protein
MTAYSQSVDNFPSIPSVCSIHGMSIAGFGSSPPPAAITDRHGRPYRKNRAGGHGTAPKAGKVYGIAGGTVEENSPVDPLTPYAKSTAMVERDLAAMADDTSRRHVCVTPRPSVPRRGCGSTLC